MKSDRVNLLKLENNFVGNLNISSEKLISPRNQLNLDPNSYKSPKNRIVDNSISVLMKSPVSQVRLSKKVESGVSDRYQKSDRKPGTTCKIQRLNRVIDLDNSIKQITDRLKKPMSIPRTQKKQNIINNSSLLDNSIHYNQHYLYGQKSTLPSSNSSNVNSSKYYSGDNNNMKSKNMSNIDRMNNNLSILNNSNIYQSKLKI